MTSEREITNLITFLKSEARIAAKEQRYEDRDRLDEAAALIERLAAERDEAQVERDKA